MSYLGEDFEGWVDYVGGPDSLDDGSDYDDGQDRYLGDGDDEYYHAFEVVE